MMAAPPITGDRSVSLLIQQYLLSVYDIYVCS